MHKMTIRAQTHQEGFIALIMVLLVAAFTVVYGLSVALMTLDERSASQIWFATSQVEYQASTCVDNAVALLRNNSNLAGNVNVASSSVTCIGVVSGSGNARAIAASATSTDSRGQNVVDRVNVNVNINTNPFTIIEYKDILE